MAKVKVEGLSELEQAALRMGTTEFKRAIRQGLTAGRRVALSSAKAASPSSRVARALRGGSTAVFRATRSGRSIELLGGGRGNLGFTAIGVPSLRRVAPQSNRRAWFVAYSLEIGNPGQSARSQNRGRYRRKQVASPFLADSVTSVQGSIVSAFGAKFKEAIKL